jgi:hypothetical protein
MLDSGMLLTGDHPRDYVELPHIMAGREAPGAIGNNPSSSPRRKLVINQVRTS